MRYTVPSLLLATVATAIPGPQISSFSYSGNGCPRNSAGYAVSPPNTTTTSTRLFQYLDEFTPRYGVGVSIRDSQKLCILTLEFAIDSAYKLRVNKFGTSINGYARLANHGDEMRTTANYTFTTDTSVQSLGQNVVQGPWNGRFTGFAPLVGVGVESKCGGGTLKADLKVHISSRIVMDGGWIGDPTPDEDNWGFMTDVEVLPC
ncbi:hypothetical protein CC86DRAFT_381529 [Ophiobolus disseminans]|uniref:Secreted protein n=1 Tax=Ophiobolus disseminans TaxID=1469910 RepID=A0A6A7A3Y3_9PLEO|nr:hypothetical protein CC86DRAFT_381529 [Ophiobolus disseminans]